MNTESSAKMGRGESKKIWCEWGWRDRRPSEERDGQLKERRVEARAAENPSRHPESDTTATSSVNSDDECFSKEGGRKERYPDGATRGLKIQGLQGVFVDKK